jgi:uncharacterized protein (TIGR00304 family)
MPDWAFLITIGIFLIILGFFLIAFGMVRSAKESGRLEDISPGQKIREDKVKGGGVILIGPVPVVFGTDKRYALILMILAIVLMLLAMLFLKWQTLRH